MRKVKVFTVSAAMFTIGFGVWTASTTNARAPSLSQGIDPHSEPASAILDAAAIERGHHVVIIVVPFAGWATNRGALEDQIVFVHLPNRPPDLWLGLRNVNLHFTEF
jgi:hypothetical protein